MKVQKKIELVHKSSISLRTMIHNQMQKNIKTNHQLEHLIIKQTNQVYFKHEEIERQTERINTIIKRDESTIIERTIPR